MGHKVSAPAMQAAESVVPGIRLEPRGHLGAEPRGDVFACQVLDGDVPVVGAIGGGPLGLPDLLEGTAPERQG
eukprot:7732392-Lingulodinium_polyedra.AAC.1